MSLLPQIIWPIGSYLLGSIPFGLLLAHCKGIALRKHGSGNIGATNVARVMGKGWGLLTLAADLAKGLLPVLGCIWVMAGAADIDLWIAFTGLGAVMGHCYSIFFRFRGGKGVATASGVFLGVCPFAVGVAVFTFIVVLKKWGYVSVGSLSVALFMPILMHFFCPAYELELMAWGITFVIWIRHRDNIKRLIEGKEKDWKRESRVSNSH
nr:glycerol-3-phosphate 1-O-acyltransferase [Deltaproteobacteria bacterium]